MKKPYIVCHMMTSVDGRIDCGMTSKLPGVDEYYKTLNELNLDASLSGKTTAKLEMAAPGVFEAKNPEPYGKTGFARNGTKAPYTVVVDSKGELIWPEQKVDDGDLIVITTESVPEEYLNDLDGKGIAWIAAGQAETDLKEASRILADEFGVKRLGIVGGGTINGAFLENGLLDEISLLLAPGVDGRKGMAAVLDGRPMESEPVLLKLEDVQKYDNGALYLKYTVEN